MSGDARDLDDAIAEVEAMGKPKCQFVDELDAPCGNEATHKVFVFTQGPQPMLGCEWHAHRLRDDRECGIARLDGRKEERDG